MKIIYTHQALADLEEIFAYQSQHWPHMRKAFELRLVALETHIREFPFSASELHIRPGARALPFGSFHYSLFYQVKRDHITILTIRHAAQRPLA